MLLCTDGFAQRYTKHVLSIGRVRTFFQKWKSNDGMVGTVIQGVAYSFFVNRHIGMGFNTYNNTEGHTNLYDEEQKAMTITNGRNYTLSRHVRFRVLS